MDSLTQTSTDEFREGIPFLGGSLWIDIINSRFELDGVKYDFLNDVRSAVKWAKVAGINLEHSHTNIDLDAELASLTKMRSSLSSIFEAMINNKNLPKTAMEQINSNLKSLNIYKQIDVIDNQLSLIEVEEISGPILATTIANDFAKFIRDYESKRLKNCDNPACTMSFYDRGKNSRRRWCCTSICGNRDKVANYRARKAQ